MAEKKRKNSMHKLNLVGDKASFPYVEAYKSLRTNLSFLSAASNLKTILITSTVPGEGKTNVAVNLAVTLASSDKKVVLIDCDLRKSSVSHYLRIRRDHPGFTNVIAGNASLGDALVRFKDVDITVLPVGPLPPNPSELLASDAAKSMFTALQQAFDYVILDTPPVTVVTDAAVLCSVADGTLLVVRPGETTIQAAQLSKKRLEAVNAHILGVVLNGYDAKRSKKKDGYYYSYYSYNSYGSGSTANETSDEGE